MHHNFQICKEASELAPVYKACIQRERKLEPESLGQDVLGAR